MLLFVFSPFSLVCRQFYAVSLRQNYLFIFRSKKEIAACQSVQTSQIKNGKFQDLYRTEIIIMLNGLVEIILDDRGARTRYFQ